MRRFVVRVIFVRVYCGATPTAYQSLSLMIGPASVKPPSTEKLRLPIVSIDAPSNGVNSR